MNIAEFITKCTLKYPGYTVLWTADTLYIRRGFYNGIILLTIITYTSSFGCGHGAARGYYLNIENQITEIEKEIIRDIWLTYCTEILAKPPNHYSVLITANYMPDSSEILKSYLDLLQ